MKVPGFHGGDSRLWIPRASAGAAAIVLSALIASGCGEKPPGPSRGPSGPPVAVEAGTAEQSLAASSQEFTASLNPIRRATPGTVLMGRVDSIRRREGDRVRSGEVLARVESRDVSARLAQAEAGLAAARAMERNAALMKERMERLLAKQAATQKNVDDAVAGYETATANVHAAEEGVAAGPAEVVIDEGEHMNVSAQPDTVAAVPQVGLIDAVAALPHVHALNAMIPRSERRGGYGGALALVPELVPIYVVTGHEVVDTWNRVPDRYRAYYDFIGAHEDVFPGFFLFNHETNVLPKYEALRQMGFA